MSIRRKVKRVIDGRTFEVDRKIGSTQIVRLAGVNAHLGRNGTDKLRSLIGGKIITIHPAGRDAKQKRWS